MKDCSNSVHRLKKNGIRITKPASTKKVAIRYVISIHNPLLFVILCRKTINHSRASEIMKAAMTIYMYDSEIYIIYHRMTIASHISQNFKINFVVFVDSAVISI